MLPKMFRGFAPGPLFSFSDVVRNSNNIHWPSERRYQHTSHSISSTYESVKHYSKAVSSLQSYSVKYNISYSYSVGYSESYRGGGGRRLVHW